MDLDFNNYFYKINLVPYPYLGERPRKLIGPRFLAHRAPWMIPPIVMINEPNKKKESGRLLPNG